LSILYLAGNRKRIPKNFMLTMTLSLVLAMLMAACGGWTVLAAGVEDVVKEVASRNARVEEGVDMTFGATETIPGGSQKWSSVGGELNTGEEWAGAWFTIVEPVGSTSMQAVIDKQVSSLDEDAIMKVVPMGGYELREITYADHSWGLPKDDIEVWIILPKYLIQVDIYETGYDKAANLKMGRDFAMQLMAGLEKAGLLRPADPATADEKKQPAEQAEGSAGKPLDEPVKVLDTMNVAGVYNRPTAPTTFSVNRPHLVTFISTYHWNNARGAAGGTIALQGSDGKTYGPWKVSTRPGQGGAPNAYWEVSPNIVIPAGTYTIIDSDPATWSQNQQSGGRGMAEVKATPHFEAAGGSSAASGKRGSDRSGDRDGWTSSPAGVGPVENIPGPSNITEAVVGVALPGLIATGLGALAGLGGGGGFTTPGGTPLSPAGGGSWPGGRNAAGAGAQPSVTVEEAGQLGRRRREPEPAPVPEAGVNAAEPGREAARVSPGEGLNAATTGHTVIPVQPETAISVGTAAEKAGVIRPGSGGVGGGVSIDTSTPEDEVLIERETGAEKTGAVGDKAGSDAEGLERDRFKREGFDKEGFDRAGFDKEGFNKDGFDTRGYDRDGFDRQGFDARGFDRDGFDRQGFDARGFDRDGFNRQGFNADGFNREGFDRAGFDAQGYDRVGFNKAGYDREGYGRNGFDKNGYDREGYGRNGFDKNGYNREGYDVNGYNQKGYNRSGYDAKGFDAQGYDREGFNKHGWDREGYGRDGLNKEGYDRAGFDKDGYDREGYNREGFDRDGRQREGYDEQGYDKDGFNEHGYDKDGYDREGFNYEGYNRSGYDPWGYDKRGYGKDGYHWSGYNADGYDRSGRHWSEPYDASNPFGVSEMVVDENGKLVIINQQAKKPPLGEPYPRTVDKYGAKPWTEEPTSSAPTVDQPAGSGINGPEDSLNTRESHGIDKDAPAAGKEDAPIPAAEATEPAIPTEDVPGFEDTPPGEPESPVPEDTAPAEPGLPEKAVPAEGLPEHEDTPPAESGLPESPDGAAAPEEDLPVPEDTPPAEPGLPEKPATPEEDLLGPEDSPSPEPGLPGLPQDGERLILVGKTDGRTYEVEYDSKTGEWINAETGNIFKPDRFEQWQSDLAEDRRRAAEDIDKLRQRQDAYSRAIDQDLANLQESQKSGKQKKTDQDEGPEMDIFNPADALGGPEDHPYTAFEGKNPCGR